MKENMSIEELFNETLRMIKAREAELQRKHRIPIARRTPRTLMSLFPVDVKEINDTLEAAGFCTRVTDLDERLGREEWDTLYAIFSHDYADDSLLQEPHRGYVDLV